MPSRLLLPDLTAGAITLVFALACARFAWQPELASFADDSAAYLVMAQVLSPWHSASQAVSEAFVREAFYPPLFPLLLGFLGAGDDTGRAHVITALLLAACLPLVYRLGLRWLEERWAAAAALAATALLPSLWIHVKGILSEPLFCLLLLAIFCALEARPRRPFLLAALMAGLVSTRSVGLIVLGAYALHALTRRGSRWDERMQRTWPALGGVAAYAAWLLLRPAGTSDDYMRIVIERGHAMLAAPDSMSALAASLTRQANALGEAWVGALMLFWVSGRHLPVVLASLVGILSLAGLIVRVVRGKADAWMMSAYLGTFLVWPFYDQMTRFLFPVLPVLLLYAFWSLTAVMAASGRRPRLAHALLVLALVSLSAPALAFIRQRALTDGELSRITDWYRTPDLDRARSRAQVHLDLLADMESIKTLTEPRARIMWVVPSYIALLADRRGVPAPDARLSPEQYREAVQRATPDYIFLSAYHPRDTLRESAWKTGVAAMAGHGEAVHARRRPDGTLGSILLKLNAPQLVARGGHP